MSNSNLYGARIVCWLTSVTLFVPLQAQEVVSAPTTLQQVNIVALKSPLEFPYQRAYEATQKVLKASDGLTDLVFKLHDKSSDSTRKLRLTLEYGESVIDIPLDEQYSFTLMPDAEVAAKPATLVINRRSQDVAVEVDIRPKVQAERITVADIDQLIRAGRTARATLLPWYARLITPTINSVRVCSTHPTAQFALRDDSGGESPLRSKSAPDLYGHPASCVDFYGERDAYVASSVLIAPKGITFDFVGSAF